MKVILLVDVAKVGRKYEEKEVADGFARNVLIAGGKALMSSAVSKDKLAEMKAYQGKQATKKVDDITKALASIPDHTISISAKASNAGHLFAGVTAEILSKELKKQFGINLSPDAFDLPKAIKEVGESEVGFLSNANLPKLKVIVSAQS